MLGDRIAVMSAGRIEQIGTAETLYRQPATDFVAGFLGTLCRVRAAVADGLLVAGDGELSFRPHHAQLQPPHPQALSATVLARFFLGGSVL